MKKNKMENLKRRSGQDNLQTSPNPIELVWDELERRVKAKQPTSVIHLWEFLQQIWEELSEELFDFYCRKNAMSV